MITNQMLGDILQARRYEKNFILRGSMEWAEITKGYMRKLTTELEGYKKNSPAKENREDINLLLRQRDLYLDEFDKYVEQYKNSTLRPESNILIDTGREMERICAKMGDKAQLFVEHSTLNIGRSQIIVLIISFLLGLTAFFVIMRTIIKPINGLQKICNDITKNGIFNSENMAITEKQLNVFHAKGEISKLMQAYFEMLLKYNAQLKTVNAEIQESYAIQVVLDKLLSLSLEDISLEEMLEKTLDIIIGVPWLSLEFKGGIFLADNEKRALVLKASKNFAAPLLVNCANVPFGKCLCGIAAQTGEIVFRNKIDADHVIGFENMPEHGHYCVPIKVSDGRVIGVLNLYIAHNHRFGEKENDFLLAVSHLLVGVIQRKKAETELAQAYKQLKQTQAILIQAEKLNVVGTLSSGVAHEVKNPLAIILVGLEYLIKRFGKQEKNVDFVLTEMSVALERADGIIKGLLDFSRVSELNIRDNDFNAMLEDSLKLVKYEMQKKKISFVKDIQQNILCVKFDKAKMEQVLINLFLNAVREMEEGGIITVKAYIKTLKLGAPGVGRRSVDLFKAGEDAFICEVKDTGPGIPDDVIDKVFDLFFTLNREKGGTGLGLSIVQNIINLHKGKIWIANNEPGPGACITFMLKTEQIKEGLR
ncbi:MAG: ATP-binding protein [Candidatus Omnitrophica bacterium]|nr:ATP-binding protein [Candidatus Omnitrophota bacterium]